MLLRYSYFIIGLAAALLLLLPYIGISLYKSKQEHTEPLKSVAENKEDRPLLEKASETADNQQKLSDIEALLNGKD